MPNSLGISLRSCAYEIKMQKNKTKTEYRMISASNVCAVFKESFRATGGQSCIPSQGISFQLRTRKVSLYAFLLPSSFSPFDSTRFSHLSCSHFIFNSCLPHMEIVDYGSSTYLQTAHLELLAQMPDLWPIMQRHNRSKKEIWSKVVPPKFV